MDTEKIRSFIAIEMPPDVKRALSSLQEKLKAGGHGGQVKWVEPGNIHLTLQFLGYIDGGEVEKITSAISQAAAGTRPFKIEVGGLGAFPSMRRVNVIWVGLSGDIEKLEQLQKRIGEKMEPLGYPPEKRPFSPHLTIGRVREYCRPEERAALGQLMEKTGFNAKYTIDVASINLMKSQLTREGPIYSRLAAVELK